MLRHESGHPACLSLENVPDYDLDAIHIWPGQPRAWKRGGYNALRDVTSVVTAHQTSVVTVFRHGTLRTFGEAQADTSLQASARKIVVRMTASGAGWQAEVSCFVLTASTGGGHADHETGLLARLPQGSGRDMVGPRPHPGLRTAVVIPLLASSGCLFPAVATIERVWASVMQVHLASCLATAGGLSLTNEMIQAQSHLHLSRVPGLISNPDRAAALL